MALSARGPRPQPHQPGRVEVVGGVMRVYAAIDRPAKFEQVEMEQFLIELKRKKD